MVELFKSTANSNFIEQTICSQSVLQDNGEHGDEHGDDHSDNDLPDFSEQFVQHSRLVSFLFFVFFFMSHTKILAQYVVECQRMHKSYGSCHVCYRTTYLVYVSKLRQHTVSCRLLKICTFC